MDEDELLQWPRKEPLRTSPTNVVEEKQSLGEGGLTIYLKIDYKVIFLFIVAFDLLHTSVDELVSRFFR